MIIVDDGIKNVDELRKRALSLNYKSSDLGNWPGYRVPVPPDISESYTIMISTVLKKELTFFEGHFQWSSSEWMTGCSHYDSTGYTSITFLNPKPEKNSGIEIYPEKYSIAKFGGDDKYVVQTNKFEPSKRKYYKSNKNILDKLEYNIKRKIYNRNFRNPTIVKNRYNRTFVFPSYRVHRAQNFFGTDKNDSRLTLICFFN